MIKIESIYDDRLYAPWPLKNKKLFWVAEIIGLDSHYGFERKFLPGQVDYSESNSSGSRGVYYYFYLYKGKIYEISEPKNSRSYIRYYCIISGGETIKITKEEVVKRLNNIS